MNEFEVTVVVTLLLLLRLAIPVALTCLLCLLMNQYQGRHDGTMPPI